MVQQYGQEQLGHLYPVNVAFQVSYSAHKSTRFLIIHSSSRSREPAFFQSREHKAGLSRACRSRLRVWGAGNFSLKRFRGMNQSRRIAPLSRVAGCARWVGWGGARRTALRKWRALADKKEGMTGYLRFLNSFVPSISVTYSKPFSTRLVASLMLLAVLQ